MKRTYQLFCGRCDQPLAKHPYNKESMDSYDTPCDRYSEHFENLHWYVDDPTDPTTYWTTDPIEDFDYWSRPPLKEVVAYADYSYNPSDIFTEETREVTEWSDLFDYYQQTNHPADEWFDAEPNQCTLAIARWTATSGVRPYSAPKTSTEVTSLGETLNLYFDLDNLAIDRKRDETPLNHVHGFTSQVIIDLGITDRFQRTVFNAYVGDDKKFRVGQLTLTYLSDGRPSVKCGHKDCRDAPAHDFTGSYYSRRDVEDYVTRVIRHGNNHGPGWLTSRSDFTYIHASNCDATQHRINYKPEVIKNRGKWVNAYVPVATPCNTNKPIFVVADLDPDDLNACYEVLTQHRKLCTDLNCRCDHYESLLWDEMYGVSLPEGTTYKPKHRKILTKEPA